MKIVFLTMFAKIFLAATYPTSVEPAEIIVLPFYFHIGLKYWSLITDTTKKKKKEPLLSVQIFSFSILAEKIQPYAGKTVGHSRNIAER